MPIPFLFLAPRRRTVALAASRFSSYPVTRQGGQITGLPRRQPLTELLEPRRLLAADGLFAASVNFQPRRRRRHLHGNQYGGRQPARRNDQLFRPTGPRPLYAQPVHDRGRFQQRGRRSDERPVRHWPLISQLLPPRQRTLLPSACRRGGRDPAANTSDRF